MLALFGHDEPTKGQFTGALILADWYHRRVNRDDAEAEAAKKAKLKRGR